MSFLVKQPTSLRLSKAALGAILSIVLSCIGCDEPAPSGGPIHGADGTSTRGQIFETFTANLNSLEDFPPAQMLPQLRDFLNHWLRDEKPQISWQPDPLLQTLPADLLALPAVERISATDFDTADMEFLMQCVWLRDIARTHRGQGFNELTIATRLFDWVVRNLQLQADDFEGKFPDHTTSEVLLVGQATARERAWVFVQLCRQVGITAVMLAVPDAQNSDELKEWLPAALIDGKLYLFDCHWGMPIPGPKADAVATLDEVVNDDGLLRVLDLDAEHPYPWHAEQLQKVTALIEASPGYLSRGMQLIESRLAGDNRITLTTHPTDTGEKLKPLPHIADAKLWLLPYEVLQDRRKRTPAEHQTVFREMAKFINNSPLYRARVLQFKGDVDGAKGAKRLYLESRPPQAQLEASISNEQQRQFVTEIKQAASYWLGIIAYEQGDYRVAVDYFRERVLIASPDGPWTGGARYNLGRSYEAMGEIEQAVAQYQLDTSPQSTGNKVRARRLLEKMSAS
jgi:hypothetical protein